jgi:hypothetical protein
MELERRKEERGRAVAAMNTTISRRRRAGSRNLELAWEALSAYCRKRATNFILVLMTVVDDDGSNNNIL